MKKIIFYFVAFLFAGTLAFNNAHAQVVVAGSGGAANGNYATLKAAFDALNLETTQAGNVITITINAGTYAANSETAPCVLNQPSTSSWTSLTITPIGAVTVSGAIAAGSPLIDLNGADNVTIDGLNASGNSLIIENTTVSATTGTSTIRLQTDATSNTITRCTVNGASSMAIATNGGNIYFGAGAISTGNDNNTVSNCNIGPSGANLPTKGVYGNGSTTTVATYNSGNTITGCNIYDYFGASVTSAGIYLAAGNTDYTITNNKFYQTATRTQVTTGTVHAGIQISSANVNNTTISGNTIGYASNSGTGTYTFVGVSSTSRFVPIYLSTVGTTTACSVDGNTVTAISVSGLVSGTSTSSPFIGIYVGSGLANIGTTTGNTIGSSTVSGSISFTSSSASSGEVYGIYFFPSLVSNISNNIVGGITATNSSTGGSSIYGIRAFTSSTVVNTFQNNQIGFAAAPISSNATTSTASRVVGLYSQSGVSIVTGNTITNLNAASPNVGTGSASSVIGLWIDNSSATIGNNISQNVIHTLSNSNAAAAVWVTGMSYNGATTGTHVVQRNLLHSFNMVSASATATMNGIYIVGGTTTYQNNMVRLGIDAAGADVTAGVAINGISEQAAGTDNIYFNSVYIGGSGVSGTGNSYAFISTITTNTRNFRNNIFYNARSNGAGSGKHYSVRVGGTAPNPTGLTINNNVYLATGTGGVFGFFNSLDVATLAAWKANVGQDVNSFDSNPQFQNPTGNSATVNLHINPSIATNVEGNGFDVVTITDDYDGQTRSGLTPVDIGADAGNFTPGGDLTGPVITYTALGNTTSTSSRSLTATITDVSGVDQTAGNKPRVYYKKSTDANDLASWKTTQVTTISVDSYTFNLDYSLLSPVVAGDVIQYFIIAQDLVATPNIGVNTAGFNSLPTSVNLIAGNFPVSSTNSYIIVGAPLAGDYTVGVLAFNRASGKNITFDRVVTKVMREVYEAGNNDNSGIKSEVAASTSLSTVSGTKVMREVEEISYVPMENGRVYEGPLYVKRSEDPNLSSDAGAGVYATITAAVNDLNLRGSSAAVRFLLLDATYPSETYPITVNYATASSTNTLTIKPNAGVTTSISGAAVGGPLFKIRNSYVTLQGSNSGGSTRDMTIENTSATTPMAIWIASTGTTPLTNTSVLNCIVRNGVNTSSALVLTDQAITTTGGYFNNITIQNNSIEKAYIGIYSFAVAAVGNGTGYTVASNSINTAGANSVRFCGIYVQGFDGANVMTNDIGNFDGTSAEDDRGIWFATGTTNSIVQRNAIHDMVYTGTGGYGGQGIVVSSGTTACNNNVQNNMIYKLSGDGWNYTTIPTDNPIGISVFSTQTGVGVYYNSIYMTGNTLNQTSALSMGIFMGTGSVADIRDNSIQNDLGLLAAIGYGTTCVYAQTSNTQFSTINYNNYYCNATGSGLKLVGQIAAATSANLAAWQAATAQDANSISGDPLYVSTTDLHLTAGSPCLNTGTPIAGITNDYDGNTRSATTPDIGADEYPSSGELTLKFNWESCPSAGTITVEIRNSTSPYAVVESVNGTGGGNVASNISFASAVNGTSYYIVVKSANSIETWSAAPVTFNSYAANYDFTTALNKAYGSNQKLSGGIPSIYQGDANQDGFVNTTDVLLTYNNSAAFITAPNTDFNCDGTTDITDVILAYNNSTNFVQKQRP